MNISIITNIIPLYRAGFYDRLLKKESINVTVYCQSDIPGSGLKSIHKKYGNKIHLVKSISSKNEKLGFQFLPYKKIIRESDVIFLDGNPRVISNLVMGLIVFFLRKKRIVIWSMAHSYGANKFTENLRLKWTSLYKNIFVYTDKEVEMLRKKGFIKHNIIGMNNGLDQKKIDLISLKWNENKLQQWKLKKGFDDKIMLLSSARLTEKNRFNQVIKALPYIIDKHPNLVWCLIGAGQEENSLRQLAIELNVDKYIHFAGAIFNEEELAPYFLSSSLFVHPASIGLGLLHAFGYGLPVVVNGNEHMHGPEYGAFKNHQTGENFMEDDVTDLANKIIDLINEPERRKKIKTSVLKIAREDYNIDVMVDRFLQMSFS